MKSDVVSSHQLADVLHQQGDEITHCHEYENFIMKALTGSFDLIVLGLSTEKVDDTRLLTRIRYFKAEPIMVLSSCNTPENRMASYQQGADDYLANPVDLTEVVLRINVLLQRNRTVATNDTVICIDQLMLNKTTQQVTFSNIDLMLTPLQFRLLWQLVTNRNQIMGKNYLYETVLDREFSSYDRSLEMHLSRIRKKLIETGMAADRLATVHGKGYRFS